MKHFFSTIVLLTVVGVIFASSVFALTISPAKVEITGDPGTTVYGEFDLLNEQADAKTLYSSFANFDSKGETGAPHFIGATDDLATWIKTESEIDLAPGEVKKISFSIDIPASAEPGGHFAAIFWGTQPPSSDQGGEVSIGGKLGILVFLKVSGQVKEGSGLLDFTTKGNKKLFSTVPVSFEYRVSNTGGDRIVPSGQVTVKNLSIFNSASFEANEKNGSVLPGSVRKFEVLWGQNLDQKNNPEKLGFFSSAWQELTHFHLGWYTANLSLSLQDKTQDASLSFFIIPWQLLSLVFAILLLIIFVGTFGIKRYNRWIIANARK